MKADYTLVDVCGFKVCFPVSIIEFIESDPWLNTTIFEALDDYIYTFTGIPVNERNVIEDLFRVIHLLNTELKECEQSKSPYDNSICSKHDYEQCHAALNRLTTVIRCYVTSLSSGARQTTCDIKDPTRPFK
jgi:hypothetical protein